MFETATREKLMQVGLTYMTQYIKALEDGKVEISTRDFLGMAAMLRTFLQDASTAAAPERQLIDPEAVVIDPNEARQIVAKITRFLNESDDGKEADDDDIDADPDRYEAIS